MTGTIFSIFGCSVFTSRSTPELQTVSNARFLSFHLHKMDSKLKNHKIHTNFLNNSHSFVLVLNFKNGIENVVVLFRKMMKMLPFGTRI